jgi:hypothetical protein
VKFMEKAMMHIHTSVPICVGFIAAIWAPEQLAPGLFDALALTEGEPLPLEATSRALLAGAMRVDFDGHDSFDKGFLTRLLIDLAVQLVGLLAVHAPRLAAPFGADLAQALKKQDTARIPGAHAGNAAGDLVGGILIHAAHMPPELLRTVLAFHRLARLPLLFRDALEMAIALLIEAMVRDENGVDDRAMLPDGDHGEIFDIQVDGDRHQVGIELALLDLAGGNFPGLREVQFSRVRAQEQDGALLLPRLVAQALLEVTAALHRVVHPAPSLPIVDLEPHKPGVQVAVFQFQGAGALVERGVIGGPRQPWLAFLLAARFPGRSMRQIRPHLANGVFDHAPAVEQRHVRKALVEVPAFPRLWMLAGCDREGLGPGEQFIGGDGALTHLQVFLRVVGDALGKLIRMRQEKVEVERARLIEHLFSGIQGRSFLGIGAPSPAFALVKEQFRRAGRLSHLVALLMRTKVLNVSSVRLLSLVVKLSRSSF